MRVDESAFRALYDANAPRIRRYLARLVGEGEADDLTQEVFARAHRGMGAHRGDSRLSTWLYRIATNAAIDRLRQAAARGETPAATAAARCQPGESSEAEREGADAEGPVVRAEMRHCILDFVDRLPPGYRAVILLGELQELPDREIAAALGIGLEAAKIRLHRARKALKQLLESGCDLYRDERNELACEPKGATQAAPDGRAPASTGAPQARRGSAT